MKKVVKVYFREKTIIDVLFNDGVVKRYDVLSLSSYYPQLNQLKDRDLFLKGKVLGVSGIKWNDDLDIEGKTIYDDGKTVEIEEPIENVLLGFRLKEERVKMRLSQESISKLTGIDQSDISKIENGMDNPTLSTIKKIAASLNKKISFIIV